jgi:hypothetical protein
MIKCVIGLSFFSAAANIMPEAIILFLTFALGIVLGIWIQNFKLSNIRRRIPMKLKREEECKMVFLVRSDLGMTKGKVIFTR